jgi:gliding motility-associated-like protein
MPDNVCVGQTRHYYVLPTPGSIYLWGINGIVQQGYTTNEFAHTWNEANTFLLEVQEVSFEGCYGPVRSGNVYVGPLSDSDLIIHNAFSPNGDLVNDVWDIGNIASYPSAEVRVYNRWGQLVWRSGKGYPHPWDGRSNGKDLPVDSYHYVIDLHNGSRPLAGHITIVR